MTCPISVGSVASLIMAVGVGMSACNINRPPEGLLVGQRRDSWSMAGLQRATVASRRPPEALALVGRVPL
jgi:hypothetical protein